MKSVPDDGGRAVGWYPDPFGRHENRYFDGTWTAQVTTNGKRREEPPPMGDQRVPIVDCPAPIVRHHVGAVREVEQSTARGLLSPTVL
jgi:hypothetical protein